MGSRHPWEEEMVELSCGATAAPVPPAGEPMPIEWHYMDIENQQKGPIAEAELQRLYEVGDVHDFTFVWNDSLPSWISMKDVPGLLPTGGIAASHGGHTGI